MYSITSDKLVFPISHGKIGRRDGAVGLVIENFMSNQK